MKIKIYATNEDFITITSKIMIIEFNNDFLYLQNKARELNLSFLATIDPEGKTFMNSEQLYLLEEEIQTLRNYPTINGSILDLLQETINNAWDAPMHYLLFVAENH